MAEQLEFFTVPSPCRGICESDARGYCRGCQRNRDERFQWAGMTDGQKREVLRLCQLRWLRALRAARRLPEAEAEDESNQPSLF